jgi:polyisoprenoid-binding protein YceI
MVMKKIIAAFLVMMVSHAVIGQTYTSRNAEFTFFSQAPLENIKAESNQGVSALNTNTGEIYFKVKIRSFQFKKGLMQEHFNEKFMESDKYPDAEFKGKINEVLDYKKAGVYPVTVTGDLNIHNVSKEYTAKATLEIKDGLILGQSVFNVRVADHKIKIPRLVFKNIAEVVEVTVSVEYKTNNE